MELFHGIRGGDTGDGVREPLCPVVNGQRGLKRSRDGKDDAEDGGTKTKRKRKVEVIDLED